MKEKKITNQTSRRTRKWHCYGMPILLCFCDILLYFQNVFLAMFDKLAIVFFESSVWFKTAMGLKSLERRCE